MKESKKNVCKQISSLVVVLAAVFIFWLASSKRSSSIIFIHKITEGFPWKTMNLNIPVLFLVVLLNLWTTNSEVS